jgi:hypothetical protein
MDWLIRAVVTGVTSFAATNIDDIFVLMLFFGRREKSVRGQTRLKRLQRHTICYSKSAVMHDTVIKLFVYHSNADHHHF